jgi:hypothetical protein
MHHDVPVVGPMEIRDDNRRCRQTVDDRPATGRLPNHLTGFGGDYIFN